MEVHTSFDFKKSNLYRPDFKKKKLKDPEFKKILKDEEDSLDLDEGYEILIPKSGLFWDNGYEDVG